MSITKQPKQVDDGMSPKRADSLRDAWLSELWATVPQYKPTDDEMAAAQRRRESLATFFGDEPPNCAHMAGAAR